MLGLNFRAGHARCDPVNKQRTFGDVLRCTDIGQVETVIWHTIGTGLEKLFPHLCSVGKCGLPAVRKENKKKIEVKK
jgi:hypothetical protein